jgi:hypothetical protein
MLLYRLGGLANSWKPDMGELLCILVDSIWMEAGLRQKSSALEPQQEEGLSRNADEGADA